MAKEKNLSDAFYESLRDVYWAEKQSVRALGKSARAAKSGELASSKVGASSLSPPKNLLRSVSMSEVIGLPQAGVHPSARRT